MFDELLQDPRLTRVVRLALRRLYGTTTATEGVARLLDADSREAGAVRLLGEKSTEKAGLKLLRRSDVATVVLQLLGARDARGAALAILKAETPESAALQLLGAKDARSAALALLSGSTTKATVSDTQTEAVVLLKEGSLERAVLQLLGAKSARAAALTLMKEQTPERAALRLLNEPNARKAAYHLLDQAASGVLRDPANRVRKGPSGARLNIGSGVKWRKADWIAVDKCHSEANDPGVMPLDVLAGELGEAFEPGSVRCIYTAHTFEHFTLAEAARVFKDCYEVLAPGAPIRIVVPDLDICVEKLHTRDYEWWADNEIQTKNELSSGLDEFKISRNFLRSIGVLVEDWYFNREDPKVIRGIHFSAYNFAILEGMLTACGFQQVTKMSCGESNFAHFADLDTRPRCSLYVEATK